MGLYKAERRAFSRRGEETMQQAVEELPAGAHLLSSPLRSHPARQPRRRMTHPNSPELVILIPSCPNLIHTIQDCRR